MTDSPLRGITGWGGDFVKSFAEGIAEQAPAVRRTAQRLALVLAEERANRSQRHADWYCSLPWYRQWWALVTGR